MTNRTKPGFLKLFVGGFALGAVALVGVQTVQADPRPAEAPTQVATR